MSEIQEREVREIECPTGVKAKIITYITARENRAAREHFMRAIGMKINPDATNAETALGQVELKNLAEISAGEDALITVGVIEFDESKEKVLDRILDGAPSDYEFIVKELGRIDKNFRRAK